MRIWARAALVGALLVLIGSVVVAQQLASIWSFDARQQDGAERVASAYRDRRPELAERMSRAGVAWPPRRVLLRAIKDEHVVELWASDRARGPLHHVHDYDICRASGGPGPKRRRGDHQVPEGFYEIDRFHPQSRHFLALGVSYPNARDRQLAGGDPGGDIFIHGGCGSVGCLAMGDAQMRELYVAADAARRAGQAHIPVHVFPTRMGGSSWRALARAHPEHATFWGDLAEGWRRFDRTHEPEAPRVDARGRYRFR